MAEREWGRLINASSITGLTGSATPRLQRVESRAHRRLVPLAHIVAMLASEAAGSVNGQAIPIDGGMVMR